MNFLIFLFRAVIYIGGISVALAFVIGLILAMDWLTEKQELIKCASRGEATTCWKAEK